MALGNNNNDQCSRSMDSVNNDPYIYAATNLVVKLFCVLIEESKKCQLGMICVIKIFFVSLCRDFA